MAVEVLGADRQLGLSRKSENPEFYFRKNRTFYWLLGSREFPVLRFIGILAFWYVAAGITCWLEGALYIAPGSERGLFQDWFMLAILPTLAVAVVTTRRLLRKLEELICQFPDMLKPQQADEIGDSLADALKRVRDTIALRNRGGKRWHRIVLGVWFFFVAIFQLLLPLTGLLGNFAWSVMPYQYPVCYCLATGWAIFYYVFVIGNITWYVLATGLTIFPVIKRYADADRLWIVPNAPDGQGGLGPIGTVAFGITTVLSSGMVLLAVWILQFGTSNPAAIVGGGLYIILVSVAFFWPLLSTHGAMRRAKRAELERIAGLFRREYEKLPLPCSADRKDQNSATDVELIARLDLMSKLEAVYSTVKAMPVWPFDLATIRKFGLLIAAPAISAVLKVIWPSTTPKLAEWLVNALKSLQ